MFKLNKLNCYRGRACEMGVFYINDFSNQIPVDGLTQHFIRVQNEDGTWIEKQCANGFLWGLELYKTYLGVYSFTAAETALFRLGNSQHIWLKLCYGENIVWQRINSYLNVVADAF